MPMRTREAVETAKSAWLDAKKAHDKILADLTAIVLRVMREVYADDPPMYDRIRINAQQTQLGARYGEVLRRCQEVCGLTISEEGLKDRDFGPTRHAVDIAIGMNDWGAEAMLVFEPNMLAAIAAFMRAHGITDRAYYVPRWELLGRNYAAIIADVEGVTRLHVDLENPSPHTTFNELLISIEEAKAALA